MKWIFSVGVAKCEFLKLVDMFLGVKNNILSQLGWFGSVRKVLT